MSTQYIPAREALTWRGGIGFLDPGPNPESLYSLSYFHECAEREATQIGKLLVAKRVQLVERFCPGQVICDVGIGAGTFINARDGNTYGFDVNPIAVYWLREHKRWQNPYMVNVPAATFWDSLEHMPDPGSLLKNITHYAFVSMPIYSDRAHALRSKHFKPGEHCWYFTHDGFVQFMDIHAFDLIEFNGDETQLGREDVETFVFRRAE